MAALDFPASPTNGQLWLGTNGVTYQWSSATTSWVAVGSAPVGSGDFLAVNPNISLWPNAATSIVQWQTVVTGNAGGWLGGVGRSRYTPPAGRYFISCGLSGYTTTAVNMRVIVNLKKNGTNVLTSDGVSLGANLPVSVTCSGEFDANGTDYFEVEEYFGPWPSAATATANFFSSIPVGVVQSMAAPGTLQLWSEVTLPANAATIEVSAPRNAKRYELQWISHCVGGVDGRLFIQGIENGVPTQTGYYGLVQYGYGTNGFIAASKSNVAGLLDTTIGWYAGTVRFSPYNAVAGGLCGELSAWAQDAATTRYSLQQGFNTSLNPANITGFRLVNSGSTPLFEAGSVLRCYVVQDTVGVVGNTGRSAFNVRATTNASYTGPGSANIFRSAVTPVVDYDPEGVWSVANAEFTAPATGRYQFSVTQHGDPASGGQYSGMVISHLTAAAAVIRNYAQPRVINTSGANSGMSVTHTLQMNAGEKIRFMLANPNAIAWAQHAEDATLLTGGATLTFASGFRVA